MNTKPKIEFKVERPEVWAEDTFGIRIYKDGKPGAWVHWVDLNRSQGNICTSDGIETPDGVIPVGWCGSKSQAEIGAVQLQELYDEGVIK